MDIEVDLSSTLGAARDQGLRPTCLAFAATGAHEILHGRSDPLCPEWLYYHAVHRAGDLPDAGSRLNPTALSLRDDGQPDECEWPYCGAIDERNWRPPALPARLDHADGDVSALDFPRVVSDLKDGFPTVLAMRIDRTFDRWDVVDDCAVLQHAPPPYSDATTHAVLAVGYGRLDASTYLKIRNSWDVDWGVDGHAWIAETYATERVYGTLRLKEIT